MHAKQLECKRLIESEQKKTFQSPFKLPWVPGLKNMDEAIEAVKRFTLKDCAGNIQSPFLAPDGAHGRPASIAGAQKPYPAVSSKIKNLKIFNVDEGGAEHCHVDNRQVAVDYVGDWLPSVLHTRFKRK